MLRLVYRTEVRLIATGTVAITLTKQRPWETGAYLYYEEAATVFVDNHHQPVT